MNPPYVWNYDLEEDQFKDILAGKIVVGRFDQDWAACRLIEYAPYKEIVQHRICPIGEKLAALEEGHSFSQLQAWIGFPGGMVAPKAPGTLPRIGS
jgi:hypothetical protein